MTEELMTIVINSAAVLGIPIEEEGAREIAQEGIPGGHRGWPTAF